MANPPEATRHAPSPAWRWETGALIQHLTARSAPDDARFVLEFLQPGIHLLDCGCGPGTITLGLAGQIAPGEAVGIDISPQLVAQAQAAAAARQVSNARFEVGDALALAYDDATFDLVFSHALLEHLPRPSDGLNEMKRVLRPGGLLALRVPDWRGNLFHPNTGNLWARMADLTTQQFRLQGSEPHRGAQIGVMLYDVGFADVRLSASYTSYGTPEARAAIAQVALDRILGSESVPPMLDNGWTTQEEVDQLRAGMIAWAETPGAFHARAWVEAVALKR